MYFHALGTEGRVNQETLSSLLAVRSAQRSDYPGHSSELKGKSRRRPGLSSAGNIYWHWMAFVCWCAVTDKKLLTHSLLLVCWFVAASVRGMQRPLVRRRHTVFPYRDLSQLCDISVGDDGTVKVADRQTRPGLERSAKHYSFHRHTTSVSQHLPRPLHTDAMADETVTSPTSPTPGESSLLNVFANDNVVI